LCTFTGHIFIYLEIAPNSACVDPHLDTLQLCTSIPLAQHNSHGSFSCSKCPKPLRSLLIC
jgi:hypothetical protein